MTEELSASEKAFNRAKKQFLTLSQRTTKALGREQDRLVRRLKKANARTKKVRTQIEARREKLTQVATEKAAATSKAQIKELRRVLAEAREETRGIRGELAAVRADLASARDHLSRALHVDKAMATLEKRWAKAGRRKAKKKPAAKKKATGKKKPAARKKATGTKPPTKKKATRRKKPATKEKVGGKPAESSSTRD